MRENLFEHSEGLSKGGLTVYLEGGRVHCDYNAVFDQQTGERLGSHASFTPEQFAEGIEKLANTDGCRIEGEGVLRAAKAGEGSMPGEGIYNIALAGVPPASQILILGMPISLSSFQKIRER